MINDPETLPSRIECASLNTSSKFSLITFVLILPRSMPFMFGKSLGVTKFTTATIYSTLAELIKSRHSVKKYDPSVKISDAELKEMLELAHKAPSSWNLQHWRFLVITSEEGKKKLHQIANNQTQVLEASATVVILGDLEANITAEEIFGEALQAGALTRGELPMKQIIFYIFQLKNETEIMKRG
jgi:hypothetical protein